MVSARRSSSLRTVISFGRNSPTTEDGKGERCPSRHRRVNGARKLPARGALTELYSRVSRARALLSPSVNRARVPSSKERVARSRGSESFGPWNRRRISGCPRRPGRARVARHLPPPQGGVLPSSRARSPPTARVRVTQGRGVELSPFDGVRVWPRPGSVGLSTPGSARLSVRGSAAPVSGGAPGARSVLSGGLGLAA